MIATLRGTVYSVDNGVVVLEVGGVGYLVQCTRASSSKLKIGQEAFIHTALIIREDAFTLYGFSSEEELELFDLLRSVSGVGPKSALAVLNELSAEQIRAAVASENEESFRSVSGIGTKTAKLITVTLAGKLTPGTSSFLSSSAVSALSGLVGLGYSDKEARLAISAVDQAGLSEQELLKVALRFLGESRGKKR